MENTLQNLLMMFNSWDEFTCRICNVSGESELKERFKHSSGYCCRIEIDCRKVEGERTAT
jgi:hypothetical protein